MSSRAVDGCGQYGALGDKYDVLAAEFLFQFTHKSGLDLVVIFKLLERNRDDDGFSATVHLELSRASDAQAAEVGLQLSR